MNIFKQIEKELHLIIEDLKSAGKLPENVVADKVEAMPPRDPAHGDIATNAAMVIAAQTGKNPREIAQLLIGSLSRVAGEGRGGRLSQSSGQVAFPLPSPPPLSRERGYIEKAGIAGPGFINMTLKPSVWQEAVLDILKQGEHYGDSQVGRGERVNVEYVSVNPTGPMHVGHARYIYGDALANLLIKAGYNVTKEYYINDAGAQVDKVADSAFLRYREACGETIGEIPEGLYPGDYLIPVGKGLCEENGKALLNKPREEWLPYVRTYAINAMMELIKADLAAIGIRHEVFTSERAIRDAGKVEEAMALLEKKGLVYTGVLEPPKGKPAPDDWEPKPQTLFRSTQFGDDCDRPVRKSNGEWTYFGPDIAYQFDKIQRGYTKLIMLLGIDHGGYVKRLKAAVAALSGGTVDLQVKLCQLVKFMRGGEPLKMSKRAGTFVTVREVVDEVGKDVFRFIMLTRKNDMPLDFDFAKVVEQSKDNPVFYVQYAHARARSVLRKAEDSGFRIQDSGIYSAPNPESRIPNPLHRLTHPEELALIRRMCNWPRLVEQAAVALEPHRVAFYLHDLAATFHGFWNQGNDDLGLRFIVKDDIELTAARIMLAQAVSKVIASGLKVLGVEPLEEMR